MKAAPLLQRLRRHICRGLGTAVLVSGSVLQPLAAQAPPPSQPPAAAPPQALAKPAAAVTAPPAFVEKLADAKTLARMRQGGLVLYMRHANTDTQRADSATALDLADCNTQRVLSAKGRQLATRIGRYIAQAGIPIGEVLHSPLCRTRETAELAFTPLRGQHQPSPELAYTANLTAAQKQPILAATRSLLSTPVKAGTNRVLVAHAPNLADLLGYYVQPEGTVAVFRPLGEGRMEYLASIPPHLWPQLLKAPH